MFLQVYSPNYVVPPAKCCSDEMDMDLRCLQIQFFYDLTVCITHSFQMIKKMVKSVML
jgi:hypothetical protein